MIRNFFRPLTLLLALPFLFTSCYYHLIEEEPVVLPDFVSYGTDIQPIFDAGCTSCHAGGSASGGLDLSSGSSYQSILDNSVISTDTPDESKLYQYFSDGHNGATSSDKNIILQWIQEGAENN